MDEIKKAKDLLDRQGWCAIRSKVLAGDVFLWVVSDKSSPTSRWQTAVRYSTAELMALADQPPEVLRLVHETKKIFGGTVLGKEPTNCQITFLGGGQDAGESARAGIGASGYRSRRRGG